MSGLKEVLEFDSIIEFLQPEQTQGVVGVVATTNNTKSFTFWNNNKWDELLSTFLNNSRNLITIVYICDKESFSCLMAFVHKLRFAARLMFEFGAYHPREDELPLKWSTIVGILILSYVYLFLRLVGTNGVKKALRNKRPPSIFEIILNNGSIFNCHTSWGRRKSE
jgi:hypothetical protein